MCAETEKRTCLVQTTPHTYLFTNLITSKPIPIVPIPSAARTPGERRLACTQPQASRIVFCRLGPEASHKKLFPRSAASSAFDGPHLWSQISLARKPSPPLQLYVNWSLGWSSQVTLPHLDPLPHTSLRALAKSQIHQAPYAPT